ncbi:hypothetical protein ACE6ED_13685 [Paenibacillus sp. CN-4]|uniref:hypothetical protein n=1 Tax=Paenibacillus nanchangensis TaxID=3348343 RepID=UPI00397DBF40
MNRHSQRLCVLASLVFLLLLLPLTSVQAETADRTGPPQVLLLYDSKGIGTANEGGLAALERLLAAYGASVTRRSLDAYEPGMLDQYTRVIHVTNLPELQTDHPAYETDAKEYRGSMLEIGGSPAARGTKADAGTEAGVTRLAGLPLDPASALAAGETLREWLGIDRRGEAYLLFKEVYPFSDLELLKKLADRLYDSGTPFLVSIRPVFTNTDFPAMQRYLDALAYVQSRNGSILVNVPVVMPSINSQDQSLGPKMEQFTLLLEQEGIIPLGVGAEMYWTYDAHYAGPGLQYFDSAVLFPDEKPMPMQPVDVSAVFRSSLYSITPDELDELPGGGDRLLEFPMDTAVTLDFVQDESQLDAVLERIHSYWLDYADYKQSAHEVRAGGRTAGSSAGLLYLDGEPQNPGYVSKVPDTDFAYEAEVQKSFAHLFKAQNQFFIIVIAVSLVVFGGLMIIGYRLYRKKYLK